MSEAGETADMAVKIMLEGSEVALKLTGTASKNIAAFLVNYFKSNTKTRGKTRMAALLKSGQPLDVYQINVNEFKTFAKEAKKYGILYSVLGNKSINQEDGKIDIMSRVADKPLINRVVNRFNLNKSDLAEIKADLVKQLDEVSNEYKEGQAVDIKQSKDKAKLVKEQNGGMQEMAKEKLPSSPQAYKSEKMEEGQSKTSLRSMNTMGKSNKERVSIREELNKLREKQEKTKKDNFRQRNSTEKTKTSSRSNYKKKYNKERGEWLWVSQIKELELHLKSN